MGWISSLFLTGYDQRSRTSFFNKYIKKNFGFSPINVEIILSTKTRLNSHGSSASFSYLRLFPHLFTLVARGSCISASDLRFRTLAEIQEPLATRVTFISQNPKFFLMHVLKKDVLLL